MGTWVPKKDDLTREWWIVDAAGLTLGRLATEVASRLRGKHKPQFTPNADTGDHVIIVNAGRVEMTGRKWDVKMYRRHSGRPGGLTEMNAAEMREKYPTRIIEQAVKGMLPKGPLGRRMIRKLKVYADDKHPHAAQQPQPLEIAGAARRR